MLFARIRAVLSLMAVALLLGSCSSAKGEPSLEERVDAAMADLPFEYRFLPTPATRKYVVFNSLNPRQGLSVNIAFGLPLRNKRCPRPPKLPVKYRKGEKPFAAAGREPLICFADDSWRPKDDNHATIVRGNMAYEIANALCEQVHDEWACFF